MFADQRTEIQKSINPSLSEVSLRPKYRNRAKSSLTAKNIRALSNLANNKLSTDDNNEDDEEKVKGEKKVKDAIKLVAITTMFGISMNLTKKRSVW